MQKRDASGKQGRGLLNSVLVEIQGTAIAHLRARMRHCTIAQINTSVGTLAQRLQSPHTFDGGDPAGICVLNSRARDEGVPMYMFLLYVLHTRRQHVLCLLPASIRMLAYALAQPFL